MSARFNAALFAFCLAVLSATAAPSNAQAIERPKVYAIVVGVSGYADGRLAHAADDAAKFSAHIRKVFGSDAEIAELIEDNAHQGGVREALHRISTLPADSFVIFYFVGHGVHEVAGVSKRENLYLLLKGATQKQFVQDAINAQELVSAIDNAERIKAMVLVDACFSGIPLAIPEADWRKSGKRAFMIASSAAIEQSLRGYFTDSVLEAWNHDPGGRDCLRPLDLFEKVQPRVYQLSQKLMDSTLVFGGDIQMCLADLREPSSLLLFRFNGSPRSVCNFRYNDGKRMMRFDPSDAVFDLIVPKKRTTIVAECAGEKVLDRVFDPKDLVSAIVEVEPIELPSYLVDPAVKAYSAAAKLAAARAVVAYGLDASDRFLDAAAEFRKVDPSFDTRTLLAEAWGPDRRKTQATFLGALYSAQLRERTISEQKNRGALAAFAIQLEDLQLFSPAGDARLALANEERDPSRKAYLEYRSFLNFAAAGDTGKGHAVYNRLVSGEVAITEEQRKTLESVLHFQSEDVRKSMPSFLGVTAWQPKGDVPR